MRIMWESFTNKTCSKLGAIKKARMCVNQETALMLYRSLVLPHLDYVDTAYMVATKDTLRSYSSSKMWHAALS